MCWFPFSKLWHSDLQWGENNILPQTFEEGRSVGNNPSLWPGKENHLKKWTRYFPLPAQENNCQNFPGEWGMQHFYK